MKWMVFLILFLSCNDDDSSGGGAPAGNNFSESGLGTPLSLSQFDESCQSHATSLTLASNEISRSYSGDGQYFGLEVILKQKHIKLLLDLVDRSNIQDIKICSEQENIPADSLEGAAIQVIDQIKDVKSYYSGLAKSKSLSGVSLNMLPKYQMHMLAEVENQKTGETQSVRYDGYMTDNAAWTSTDEGEYSLMFFPKSAEATRLGWFSGRGLWEVPYVIRHEYSHHIFHHHLREASAAFRRWNEHKNNILSRGIFSINNVISKRLRAGTDDAESLISNSDQGWVALNEGFADIFSFASLGSDDEVDSLVCFAKNRQMTSSTFYDGVPKELNHDVLDSFDLDEPISGEGVPLAEDSLCQSYSYTDPHIIGAIFAYGLYYMYGSDISALGSLSLEWLDRMKSMERKYYTNSRDLFGDALDKALQVGVENGVDQAEMYKRAKSVFPALRF